MALTARKKTVLLGLIFISAFGLAASVGAQSGVQYIYDELGRLAGLIDPSGNAAAYKYDAVGNLLSITRYSSTQVSIIQFTPTSGPVGKTVTISGTGFSSTPSQNTLRFNGTLAIITSATANQIVTSVPAGATTGPVSVITPAGTFTTTTSLTVTTSTGAPTINAFSPTTGPVGTTVTINGTGFSTTLNQNTVKFNGTFATITSSTATQIVTSVPIGATSGPISVKSSNGTAASSTPFTVTAN